MPEPASGLEANASPHPSLPSPHAAPRRLVASALLGMAAIVVLIGTELLAVAASATWALTGLLHLNRLWQIGLAVSLGAAALLLTAMFARRVLQTRVEPETPA